LFDTAALGWVESLLGFALDLLTTLLLVVLALHVLELASKALDLVLVLIDLSLVHVKFSGHGLHLSGLLLEVLLVDRELFGNLGTGLSGKQVLKFNVELLLLLDDNILLNNLLGLLNETLLEGLDLLEHFPGVWVSALKLSPTMVVERVLEFLRQCLNLKSLSQ
jgi:hypothetical protein